MLFDITKVPYSIYGSYFTFCIQSEPYVSVPGLYFRTVHGDCERDIFRVEMRNNDREAEFKAVLTECGLTLVSSEGSVEICICENEMILFQGNCGLRFIKQNAEAYDYVMESVDHAVEVNSCSNGLKFRFVPIRGGFENQSVWNGKNNDEIILDAIPAENELFFAIKPFDTTYEGIPDLPDMDYYKDCNRRSYMAYLENAPKTVPEYEDTRELAAYVNWAAFVHPFRNFKRDTMLMSKNYMTNIWSWDHCFTAMALYQDDGRSFDQLMCLFDHQDTFGALPDSINDTSTVLNFCKPPIHGWALDYILRKNPSFSADCLKQLYTPLSRWTNWWLTYRDEDKDGLPEYHHGNDSGWDNGTIFAEGVPVESPDVSAFLITQMDVLSKLAEKLGISDDAQMWKTKADTLLDTLIANLWDGKSFFTRLAFSHKKAESNSMQNYLPLILGNRLPKPIFDSLVTELKSPNRFITPFGVATEALDSPDYVDDGYWRGPIWAPTTMILVSGLMAGGETELAHEIASSFCDNCVRHAMAENFSATTGQGLRDKAYTWTSSVFLILSNML